MPAGWAIRTAVCLAVWMSVVVPARAQTIDTVIAPPQEGTLAGNVALRSMYATTILVQGLDFHSTFRALDQGAIEINPVVKPFTSSKPAFAALKAGMAVSTIYIGKSLARRSKTKAIIAMAAINAVHTAIVVKNYRASRLMAAQRAANGG